MIKQGCQNIPIGLGVYDIKSDEKVSALIKSAVKSGCRLIDTAAHYGNEASVGIAINKLLAEGVVTREDLFVVTKLPDWAHGYEKALKAFSDSISKLGLDYVDLYLIHWPVVDQDQDWKKVNNDTWRAFEELYEQGKIKHLGVSNFLPHHLRPLLKDAKIKSTFNQIELHPLWQQQETAEFCKANGINILAWGSLAQNKALEHPVIRELAHKYQETLHRFVCAGAFKKVTSLFLNQ